MYYRININVDSNLYEKIKSQSDKLGLKTFSATARYLIVKGLETEEEQ